MILQSSIILHSYDFLDYWRFFRKFRIPASFSNVLFFEYSRFSGLLTFPGNSDFQISCFFKYHDFPKFPGTPEFLICPAFPGFHVFPGVLGVPEFSIFRAFFVERQFLFQISGYPRILGFHVFLGFPATPECFQCPAFGAIS